MKALACLLVFWLAGAGAQPLPDASLQERLGAAVPLDVAVRDAPGRSTLLADYFDARTPVLLVLGYYRCPQLCGLVMHGLLDALHAAAVPAERWSVVGLSIDPQDAPVDAHRRREQDLAYARWLQPGAAPRLDLLVAAPADVARIARAVGVRNVAQGEGFVHPATVVVLTPKGQVAGYVNGVGPDASALRAALSQAAEGSVGGWRSRLAVLCSHFDPALGRHSGAVVAAMRALAVATVVLLAGFAWRQARNRRRA